MKNRTLIVTCAAALGLTACKDVGLSGLNRPFEDAEHASPEALVVAVHGETQGAADVMAGAETVAPVAQEGELGAERKRPVAIGDRFYIVSGRAQEVPQDMLRPIGSFQGRSLYALTWDEQPFDRLYTEGPRSREYWELQMVPDVGPLREPEEAGGH